MLEKHNRQITEQKASQKELATIYDEMARTEKHPMKSIKRY